MGSYFKTGSLQILNIVAFVAMVLVNGLADLVPINGKTTGEISDEYPNLFVPASFTFLIWAIIYGLLLLFCIYQGRTLFESEKKFPGERELIVDRIGNRFILSCLLNILWIFAWHYYATFASVLIMLALLATLISIYQKIQSFNHTQQDKWFVYVPFSVYLGWISVATIANVTAYLTKMHWNGWGLSPTVWAWIMISVAIVLGLLMLIKKKNIFFALVIVWALTGIMIKHHKTLLSMA